MIPSLDAYRRLIAVTLILVAAAVPLSGQSSLSTTFLSNNGQAGNMFDVVAWGAPVTICSFDLNLDPGSWNVEVYTLVGSWQGNANNASAWTLLGSVSGVVSNGQDVPTPLLLSLNVPIIFGTQAFYVTVTNGAAMNYTNGSAVGQVYAQNSDLSILEGCGLAYPFGGAGGTGIFQPRVWNGTIHYVWGIGGCTGFGFALNSVIPSSVIANGPAFNLSVLGSGFTPQSVIFLDNNPAPTTFIASSVLQAAIPAGIFPSPGTIQVAVQDPSYGTTNSLPFSVLNPPPVLVSISPASVLAGSGTLTLAITGSGFVAGSQVAWNGATLSTTYLSSTQLQASVPAANFAVTGTAQVSVINAGPGGGTSSSLTFAIAAPPPVVAAISPSTVPAGSPAFTLIVDGSGFQAGAVVRWNGASLTTVVAGPTRLQAQVSAALVASASQVAITAANPAPNPATSNATTLFVRSVTPNTHELISVDSQEIPANADAFAPAVSRDARFTAFHSAATNLVANDTNARIDIFVRDRLRQITSRVSVTSSGLEANGDSTRPAISADGKYVVFNSTATNLIQGLTMTVPQVYRVNRDTDNDGVYDEPGAIAIEIVSLGLVSIPANAVSQSFSQAVSVNGQKVVFQSAATNLVAVATGGHTHTYVRDLLLATTSRLSASQAGNAGDGSSHEPAISGDGSFAAFHTDATNLFAGDTNGVKDVVRKALTGGVVGLVSRATGSLGALGNGDSLHAAISESGQWVAFDSVATNLGVPGITGVSQVFRRDLNTNVTLEVSKDATGNPGLAPSEAPAISPTGCVLFRSQASNLYPAPWWGFWNVLGWDLPNIPPCGGCPHHVPASMYGFPYGSMGSGVSGTFGLSVSASFSAVVYSSSATNLFMGLPVISSLASTFIVATLSPFSGVLAPPPGPDSHPVTFSVAGPVDRNTEGLAAARGLGSSSPFFLRVPAVPPATGLPSGRPGDVNDYLVAGLPTEAELFQSEPDNPGAAPVGTDNQILVAPQLGLVAGPPAASYGIAPPYRDNIDGISFGEDYFGVTATSPAPAPQFRHWVQRTTGFVEPIVTGDSGTSFRFSIDPWAIGLPPTDVFLESGGADFGAGLGPWSSPGVAAGDVFGTPVLVLPGPPAPGINTLVHDNVLIGLAPLLGALSPQEDNLDALECVGENNWGAIFREPGSLHARVLPLEPAHTTVGDLAPPAIANHAVGAAPVFFTVDRDSTGAPLSAVRTQWLSGEAAGDVFMSYLGTNFLLIDETEAGLYPGLPVFGINGDNMDALLLCVQPESRDGLLALASETLSGSVPWVSTVVNAGTPQARRIGYGFTTSLLRMAYDRGTPLKLCLGFSVTTDSIGLEGTAVDFEAGLDPSGFMQQAGDIFYTSFGPGSPNPAPAMALGMNWRWHEEIDIGLDPGSWRLGVSTDLASLPDELDGLDALCSEPTCTGSIMTYGNGCAGTGGYLPVLGCAGWASPGSPVAFSIHNAMGGSLAYVVVGAVASIPVPTVLGPQWPLFVNPVAGIVALPLAGVGPGNGAILLPGRISLATPPSILALQAFIVDPGAPSSGISTTNALALIIQ